MLKFPSPVLRQFLTIVALFFLVPTLVSAQNNLCGSDAYAKTLGTIFDDARGYSLAVSPVENVLYIGGVINDSVAIIKMNATDEIIWTRTFDIVPGLPDHLHRILVDSDGNIVVSGVAGPFNTLATVFAFRYDPINNVILWSKQFISYETDFNFGLEEMFPDGDFIMCNNPGEGSNDDAQVIKLNRLTGEINPEFSKHYDLGASESLNEMIFHDNFLYASGRFTDGDDNEDMRNTLIKMDPVTGTPVWTILGHVPDNVNARLYGEGLVIDQDEIYSISTGDPDGTSINSTEIFVQKTSLSGDVIWMNRYDLPGNSDYVDEIIKSEDGFVIMARTRIPPSDIILLKVDREGNLLWARSYDFSENDNAITRGGIQSPLRQFGDHLYFTAFSETNGSPEMVLVKTDLEGKTGDSCTITSPISIDVVPIQNPFFYNVEPTVFSYSPETITLDNNSGIQRNIQTGIGCNEPAQIIYEVEAIICEGEMYEGYAVSGTFVDTFKTSIGCDSIRTLHLTVNACQPECGTLNGPVYGSLEINEKGYCLAATPEGDGAYIAGIREDSILLLKVDLKGAVQWSRVFDLVRDSEEYPFSLIVDSEGMIALAGTTDEISIGGPVFVLRYDPYNHQVLWSNEYISIDNAIPGAIIQKGNGGNYVLLNDLNDYANNHIDVELLELNINTGAVLPSLSKKYRLSNRESLFEIVYDGNFIYGTGRYKADDSDFNFRNTLVKLNADDGTQVWVKMGHFPNDVTARLYGGHLIIDQNAIISGSYGDPAGTSITNTNLYLQKTDLDGNVIWLKQYNISETNSFCYGIIRSGDGYIVLSGKQQPASDLVMFKIDLEGEVLWAKTYQFSPITDEAHINATLGGRGQSKVIQVSNQLFFTGYGINTTGGTELLVVRTDLEGNVDMLCVKSQDFTLTAIEINNPVFFSVNPVESISNPVVNETSPDNIETRISPREECSMPGTIFTTIEATICEGESFEGYIQSGIFPDTFLLSDGCDSIRTLRLSVISCEAIVHYNLDACRSYMDDGSHMDYTEFIPAYPTILPCADVSAGILHRDPSQKHSCTPGIAGSPAMCVTTLNSCTYLPGNEASVIIEVTINPYQDSAVMFTGFEFYEKSPATFSWIDGDSGPNDYPRFYGIRILKNGTEIFRQTNIATTTNWTLQSFDFISNDLFRVEENTVFRIELLPYCPVGNGALVSAWDIDEFKIFGGCIPVLKNKPIIIGQVHTKTGKEFSDLEMILDENQSFTSSVNSFTDHSGHYIFENLVEDQNYYLQGYKNDDVLNGVSTLDIIQIQKHLLGKKLFTSLHQYIAADVNRSNHVSAVDILDLRKLLLGIYSEFPRNTSWRFGPLPQDFTEVDPGMFEEIKYLELLALDTTIINFVGIKIGDLNDNAEVDLNAPVIEKRNSNGMTVRVKDQTISAGNPFSIEFTTGDYLLMDGMQFAIKFKNMELVKVGEGKIPITQQHISITEDGLFRLSWNQDDAVNVLVNDVLFTVTLKSGVPGLLSDKMEVLKNGLKAEAYAADDLEVLPLEFEFQNEKRTESGFLHIEPNPVHNNANLRFHLVNGGQATIRFYDASGKLLYSFEKEYLPGEHLESVAIDKYHSAKGIIYCQLISTGYTSVQKFVMMN